MMRSSPALLATVALLGCDVPAPSDVVVQREVTGEGGGEVTG
jgi:hypothetical protein